MTEDATLRLECEACGASVPVVGGLWALDKYGEVLCRDCHLSAVMVLKMLGQEWKGQTFGYEIVDES